MSIVERWRPTLAHQILAATTALIACGGSDASAPPVPTAPTVATITVDKGTLTFSDVGLTDTIRATARNQNGNAISGVAFSWASSDTLVVTVSNAGVVRTTGLGSAQITVSAAGKSAQTSVSVPAAVTTIVLNKTLISFAFVGQRDTLRATARDQSGRAMTGVTFAWSTSDPNVAVVDVAGVVTARGQGTAQLTATASSKTATARATVPPSGPETTLCSGGPAIVMLLVDPQIHDQIASPLGRFAADLCADGYTVWAATSVPATPPDIRAYLRDAWTRTSRALTGAILIGNIPHAYQYVILHSTNPSIPDSKEEAISFQYYADLNGTFSASPGYTAPHPFSFDVHDGDTNWELWIGVLPMYKGSTTATIDALTRYFDKNHAYRTGGSKPPRVFVQVNEHFVATTATEHDFYLAALRDGTYSWTPFSNAPSAKLYFASATGGLTAAQGYAALQAGAGDFFEQDSHGFYAASGQLTIAIVESTPVRTIFYWSNGCAIGDLDRADNFLTSVVYSPTSNVLVGKGTTNNSGGMGNNANGYFGHNVAVAMSTGASIGAAILSHVNVPLISPWSRDREFHFATPVLIGDPTLKLRP